MKKLQKAEMEAKKDHDLKTARMLELNKVEEDQRPAVEADTYTDSNVLKITLTHEEHFLALWGSEMKANMQWIKEKPF